MTADAAAHEANDTPRAPADRRGPATFAVALAAAAILAVMAGFPYLRGQSLLGADNDSMLRLVEVRDLIAGQGWFDLTQRRLGLGDGVEMHWSRLIDAPLAGLVLLARFLGLGESAAETLTLLVWPALLAIPALYAIIRASRGLSGDAAMLPATAIGVAALFYSGQFRPGAIDHHSAQAALALLVVMTMTSSRLGWREGALAGAAAAAMAGIGAESHPHVALAALGAAAIFAFAGHGARGYATGFGLAFAATLAAIFLGTIAPEHYRRTVCDALSIAQAAPGVAGGLALALTAAATPERWTIAARLAALAAAAAGAALVSWPYGASCLADPLAGISGLARTHWLDLVEEARPLFAIGRDNPALGLSYGVPPLIALLWIAWRIRRGAALRPHLAMGGAVAVSYAIALVQVRGAVLAMLLSTIPLATFVAAARSRAEASPTAREQIAMVGAWLSSIALVWAALGAAFNPAIRASMTGSDEKTATPVAACTEAGPLAALAAEPATTVFAISNLGSAILVHTPHRAIAAPYHRNAVGLTAAIEAMIAPSDRAEALVRKTGATLVASCANDPETQSYGLRHPDGFIARLAKDEAPAWLTPFGPDDGPVRLYRLTPAG